MNDKLLEQKAEEYRNSRKDLQYFSEPYKEKIEQAYIAGATEETKLLSEHILELQKTNGSLTDRVNEAREIIKEYLRFTVYTQVSYDPLRQRAEQFLGDEK